MLLINKLSGPTSHDVVNQIRKHTGEKRVGHAGTLDPFAEGLLIVLVGREETRRQSEFLLLDKNYEGTIILGAETDTGDLTGKIINPNYKIQKNIPIPNLKTIKQTLETFVGEQTQMPPEYSAKKIRGKKAYELARKGEKVVLKSKKITIYWIKLKKYKWPELKIEVKVSSGTYIRALARDIGRKLGTGAYLSELKRTHIGKYKLKNSLTLEELKTVHTPSAK